MAKPLTMRPRETQKASNHDCSTPPHGPLVQFARYNNLRLEMLKAHTDQLKYYAISHVWGKTQWMRVSCMDDEILVSPEKAKFIEEELPALVGDTPFWMDTLTVNQRVKSEVIDTVQSIPAIFRDSAETIAVREGDGIYSCCGEAIQHLNNHMEIIRRLLYHVQDEHMFHVYEESYLQRLWTLQECLLSHTIHFVTRQGQMKQRENFSNDPYWSFLSAARVKDSLFTLAHGFSFRSSDVLAKDMTEFLKAYIGNGIAKRPRPPQQTAKDDIFNKPFDLTFRGSPRVASESRDYIFATMPQFPWYHYPEKAEKMTFNENFQDLHEQARDTGHAFTCRITRSMTDPTVCNNEHEWWKPSPHQPEPSCLGDFTKLLGRRLEIMDSRIYRVNAAVVVYKVSLAAGIESLLKLIEVAMRFSPVIWVLSHRGGELSKYGAYPEDDNMLENNRESLYNISQLPYTKEREEYEQELRTSIINEETMQSTERWRIPQAMKILDAMFCAIDKFQNNPSMEREWEVFKQVMEERWPEPMQYLLLLLAGMVSCQIPLSAVKWANENFVPVKVHLEDICLLGLLAKHACSDEFVGGAGQSMVCLGRYGDKEVWGMDLTLADPNSEMPVGLVPDLIYVNQPLDEVREMLSFLRRHLRPRRDTERADILEALKGSDQEIR